MSQTDRFIANAASHPDRYSPAIGLSARPSAGVAVVACMDARIDVHSLLGLVVGEAHVIRNAGGLLTEDAVRSLAISQRLLGTTEIILIHHTGCGLEGLDDDEFAAALTADTGQAPPWLAGGFTDPAQDVRESMSAVKADPFIPNKNVRGFVFDVHTGRLTEVS